MLGQRQDAEDAAQETFVRVLRSLPAWDRSREFEPWLLAIAGNRCRTMLAARKRIPTTGLVGEDQLIDRTTDGSSLRSLREEVQLALLRLRPEYREAFILFHENELSYDQIAEAIRRPLGTVKTWIHKARQQLMAQLRQREVVGGRGHAMRSSLKNGCIGCWIDGKSPSEDSRLNRHADRCPECRETLAACGRMIDGLNLMELPVPGDDFPLRVVRRTQVGRPSLAASRRVQRSVGGDRRHDWRWRCCSRSLGAKTARSRLPPPARRLRGSRTAPADTSPTVEARAPIRPPEPPARNCLAILARPRSATAARPVAQLDSVLVRPLEPRGRLGGWPDPHHDALKRRRRRNPPDDPARAGRPPRRAVGRFGPGPREPRQAARRVKLSDKATRCRRHSFSFFLCESPGWRSGPTDARWPFFTVGHRVEP